MCPWRRSAPQKGHRSPGLLLLLREYQQRCFRNTMVEVVILSAVKRECIQSAQPLKWVFLLPFASLYHLSKCSSEQETRTKVINSEGRARCQEDEEGEEGAAPLTIQGHSYLHKQLTGTLANPVRNRLDNDLDNKAIHC